MTPDSFVEKFDLLADAPNAVDKMRELVLQEAVCGNLVPQDPHDEPASTLIEDAKGEREELIDEGRIKRPRGIRAGSEFPAEAPLPLPWEWTTLAEISLINPRNDASDDTPATFIPMSGIPQTYGGDIVGETRAWGDIRRQFTHFANGDVVLAKITPCFQNGKSAILSGLENSIGAGTTELHVARPLGQAVLAEYVWIFLKSPRFLSDGVPVMTGSAGQKRIPAWYFALKPFPLPPLAEQKRIVAKVDELMALCDRLEAQQQERETQHAALARASLARFADAPSPANLKFLFHESYSIPASDLRASILALAAMGKLASPSEVWEAEKLENVTTKIGSGATPKGGREAYHDDGIPLIRSMNVYFQGFDYSGLVYLNEEQASKLKNATVEPGDVLLNITGASIGRVTVAPDSMAGARVNQHVAIIRPKAALLPPFLSIFLASPVTQSLIEGIQVGATRQALTKSMIQDFQVPAPSLAAQRETISRVEQLMDLVGRLETQICDSRDTGSRLLEAVVAELEA